MQSSSPAGLASAPALASYANTPSKAITPWSALAPYVSVGGPLGGPALPGSGTIHLRVSAAAGPVPTVCTATFVVNPALHHEVIGRPVVVPETIPSERASKAAMARMQLTPVDLHHVTTLLSVTEEHGDFLALAVRAIYAAYVAIVLAPSPAPVAYPPASTFPAGFVPLFAGDAYVFDVRRTIRGTLTPALASAAITLALADFGHPPGTTAGLGAAWAAGPGPIFYGHGALPGFVPSGPAEFFGLAEAFCSHCPDPAAAFEKAFHLCASLLHVADVRAHAFGGVNRAPNAGAASAILHYLVVHAAPSPGLMPAVMELSAAVLGVAVPPGAAPVPAVPALRPVPPPGTLTVEELSALPSDVFWATILGVPAHPLGDPFAAMGGALAWLPIALAGMWGAPMVARPPVHQTLAGLPSLPVAGLYLRVDLPYPSGIFALTQSLADGAALPSRQRPPVPLDYAVTFFDRLFLSAAVMRCAADSAMAALHVCPASLDAAQGDVAFLPLAAQPAAQLLLASQPLACPDPSSVFALACGYLADCDPALAVVLGMGTIQVNGPVPLLEPWPLGGGAPPSPFLMSLAFCTEQLTTFSGSPAAGGLSRAAPELATASVWALADKAGLGLSTPASVIDGTMRLAGVALTWAAVFSAIEEPGLGAQATAVALPALLPRMTDGAGLVSWGTGSLLHTLHVPLCSSWNRIGAGPTPTYPPTFLNWMRAAIAPGPGGAAPSRNALRPMAPNPAPATALAPGGVALLSPHANQMCRPAASAPLALRQRVAVKPMHAPAYWVFQPGSVEGVGHHDLASADRPTEVPPGAEAASAPATTTTAPSLLPEQAASNFSLGWARGPNGSQPNGLGTRGGRGGMHW